MVIPMIGLADAKFKILKIVIYCLLAVVGFYFGSKKSEAFEVFVTAFIGAYAFVRGISLYGGGYPSELTIDSEQL